MSEPEWTEYRDAETQPAANRKVEVSGAGHISGVYHSADELQWDYLPLDGSVRWRYA
jgi:hypothetical protein